MLFRGDDVTAYVRRRREHVAVAALLVVALAVRVYQFDWDQGHLYHPDERFILLSTAAISLSWPLDLARLLTPQSTLVPQDYSYSYGTLSLYLLRAVTALLTAINHLLPFLHFLDPINDLGNLRLVGRPISAIFDTATVFFVYWIGRLLYGRRTAFLAATFVAFSVIDVQLSHFYATDTIMTALVIGAIATSVAYLQTGRTRWAVWAGVFTGLALATKASAAPVLAPVVAAQLARLLLVESADGTVRLRVPQPSATLDAIQVGLGTLAAAVLVFIIAEPYAIIDFQRFVGGISEQSSMVRGVADLPYTRQYFARPAYLYFLQNLVLFGVGIPLGLAMIGGWLYVIARNVFRPRRGDLVLLAYVIPYFIITGDFWAKFLRYMLPISPLLALFAAVALVRLIGLGRSWWLRSFEGDEVAAAPAAPLKLPPELVNEETAEALDVADLTFFDGDALAESFDGSMVGEDATLTSTVALSAADPIVATRVSAEVVADVPDLDPDSIRWLELKGLSAEFLSAPALTASAASSDELSEADLESLRIAQLKGLSLDWFTDTNGSAADTSGVAVATRHVSPAPRAPIDDEWVELESVENALPDEDRPYSPPPAWLARNPRLGPVVTGPWITWTARGIAGVVIAFSVFYTLAFIHMYASPTTPVLGSEWLYRNAPRGSVLATEHWEEGMPVPIATDQGLETGDSFGYRNITMPMYEDDTPAKLDTIVNNLVTADYVVFFSNRLYGTVPRIPGRYPMSQRYYEALFGEKLGFTLVDADARYPNLLGVAFMDDTLADPGLPTPKLLQEKRPAPITINLGHADESFSVYDHQKVLIFKKTERLTPDQLRALIGPPPAPNEVNPTLNQPVYKPLLLSPAQEAIVNASGTYSSLFDRADLFNRLALLTWIVLIALIGLAGVPLGFAIFRFLPDRGFLVSKTLAILVLVWVSWIVVSSGIVLATRTEALAVFAVILLFSGWLGYRQRHEIVAFWRANRRLLLAEEGVFWLAFLYDVYVRSLNPDLWHPTLGGEKPMDLAFYTAATRSPIYPPYDPWFAGGYLNYYYFGQIIVGTLTKISGVVPTTSYNVVVPLLFALTVGGAFTAALALVQRGTTKPGGFAIGVGVLSALMVCVAGNIGGFVQLVTELQQIQPPAVGNSIVDSLPLLNVLRGLFAVTLGGRPFDLPQDWYWSSTRALALLNIPGGTGSINEFPYFTFLFADLHAHLIGLPFTLLALALGVNIVKSGGLFLATTPTSNGTIADWEPKSPLRRWLTRRRLSDAAIILTTGLVVGALYPINSWDYPTYVGLVALALLVPWYLSRERTLRGLIVVALQVAAIVLLSQLLYRPFYASFQSFYSGVHLSDEKSELRWYFVINGLFLVIMVSYFLLEGWANFRRSGTVRAVRLYVTKWDLLPRTLQLQQVLVRADDERDYLIIYGCGLVVIALIVCLMTGMALVGALLVVLVAALALALRRAQSPEDTLVSLLFATGLAISIGTEILVIDGDVGRMNTIFKFYEQIWVLFGVAGAVAVARIWERLRSLRLTWLRRSWVAVLVAFFLMASIYPVLGTISRVSQRFSTAIPPTLDGTAYMDNAVYVDTDDQSRLTAQLHFATDKAAITWLQDHVQGTPTILEGWRPLYRFGARMAIYTGLPAVIGWDWHEKQQRSGFQYEIDDRLNDVRVMYDSGSPDTTLSLLRKYGVTYIIDGELEQGFYPQARAKFDSMVGTSLSVAYDEQGVRIYQVK
jgi:YYY domain-containing protein